MCVKSNLCLLAFIYLSFYRVPALSFDTCVILLVIIERRENDEDNDEDNVAVIVLSFVSGFLCLGIFVCFVYHKRRVSGMVNMTKQALKD